jgi:F-type H+-transporting ATPase subunit b
MSFNARAFFLSSLLLLSLVAVAQEPAAKPQAQSPAAQSSKTTQAPPNTPSASRATPADERRADQLNNGQDSQSVGGMEAEASREAAGEEGGENAVFRESPSVKWLSRHTGIPLKSAYWVFIALNFAALAFIIYLISKSRLPQMFRSRTDVIRKSLDEAQRASAEANRRLTDIESRLSRLDTEVAQMRTEAEREAAAEEQRIQAAAAEDQRRIVNAAQTEIDAVAKNARRELKSYAADLAVALAEKRIHVDAATDQQLVRSFTDQLGANGDGKGRS